LSQQSGRSARQHRHPADIPGDRHQTLFAIDFAQATQQELPEVHH
jgi:hypothetical protein